MALFGFEVARGATAKNKNTRDMSEMSGEGVAIFEVAIASINNSLTKSSHIGESFQENPSQESQPSTTWFLLIIENINNFMTIVLKETLGIFSPSMGGYIIYEG